MELGGQWPPVVVWTEDNSVIDGTHRVVAAQRLGIRTLPVLWFQGSADDAYIEAVRCNSRHGLPLTSGDRARAVKRILDDHPEWSDRRISDICAVAAKTVAGLRDGLDPTMRGLGSRVGKDGRCRPVHPGSARERIKRLLQTEPGRSLRSVATPVGASPETVRRVRNTMRPSPATSLRPYGADKDTASIHADAMERHPAGGSRLPDGAARDTSSTLFDAIDRLAGPPAAARWGMDAALTSRSDCREFATWFQSTAVRDDWRPYVTVVPLGRVYEIADEARCRAEFWAQFAGDLEARVRRSPLRA